MKPANLMLSAPESDEAPASVKVIDFGVAKALAENPDAMGLTQGGFVGTPAFASPEQFTSAPVDVRSDIYSLGVTLWYLLTGQTPFPGRTLDEIVISRESGALPIATLRAARAPHCLVSLLVTMLAPAPAARPSVRELTARLQRCRAILLDRWKLPRRIALAAGVVAVATSALFVMLRPPPLPNSGPTGAIPLKSIAVLPFQTRSQDNEEAYFADGVQDQILTKLAGVAELKVISRTSAEKYRGRQDVKAISHELSAANLLQGTVAKEGQRVRIEVDLIEGGSAKRIWARSYDVDLRELFALETEIAQQVANAMRAKLSLTEEHAVSSAPTRDPQAYDLFLRAEHEQRQGEIAVTAGSFANAAGFYLQAIDLDPSFALAAARFVRNRMWWHWMIAPLSPPELTEVRTLATRTVTAAPDLAASHAALGFVYYHANRDYEAALASFQRALTLQPNNADVRQYCGYVRRRQGDWDGSLADMAKAEELDPHDAAIPANQAATYVNLRQWNDAKRAASRAVALAPNNLSARRALFLSSINGDGRIDAARRVLGPMPRGPRQTTNNTRGSVASVIEEFTYLHVLERDFAGAVTQVEKANGAPAERLARLVARAAIHVVGRDAAIEHAEAEEARGLLEEKLLRRPDDGVAMTELSWVYLALGRHADALRIAGEAAEWVPIGKDAFGGPLFAAGLAQVNAQAGNAREAVKILRNLLSIPAGTAISMNRLKVDPVWDPIRDDLRFQELLAGPEMIGKHSGYGQLKAVDARVATVAGSAVVPK